MNRIQRRITVIRARALANGYPLAYVTSYSPASFDEPESFELDDARFEADVKFLASQPGRTRELAQEMA